MNPSGFLIGPLLKEVSRSFYLTLRILPGPLRAPVSLAYLLARATDTIADTRVIGRTERRHHLQALRRMILEGADPRALGEIRQSLGEHQQNPSERILLERLDESLEFLGRQSEFDRAEIRRVLEVIVAGQDLDLERFGESADELRALPVSEDLEDYTYRVAGCVGEFWTRMCAGHLSGVRHWGRAEMIGRGIRFGKGLQLVNILRDMPRDLRNGRCYLPATELQETGVTPEALLDARNFDRVRPVYARWLARAREHLDHAWDYTCAYPRSLWRMRLACAWPVLIGHRTLDLLGEPGANPLDPARTVKVTRAQVRRIVFDTGVRVFCDKAFGNLHRAGRKKQGEVGACGGT
ncbi:MAG: phytoene/squalene synthase family protein [Verrucomicrobiae bacterium]|nr:phytoene/squalene synthase family protein [Verrucomicrobiae bacterium]